MPKPFVSRLPARPVPWVRRSKLAAYIEATASDLDIATRTLYGEARGEPLAGQQAVAWVFRNRVEWMPPQWWGVGLAGVCQKPYQFSCWLQGDSNREKLLALSDEDPVYLALYEVVESVMHGDIDDPTGRASHYEVTGTGAKWAVGREPTLVVGHHSFYSIGP